LENGWNVAPLTNHSNNRDESLGEWLVHDVVFSNGVNQVAYLRISIASGNKAAQPPPRRCLDTSAVSDVTVTVLSVAASR